MLALTHHALVQFAFFRITKGSMIFDLFKDYAILGDDIVIASGPVAQSYLRILKEIGMEASMAKSLVSKNRIILEFAKRFFIPMQANMIPIQDCISARRSLALSSELSSRYSLE